ncbi:HTH domain-containing protein [Lactococcus piscium]|nr:HTH domain-containing protein [Lactococcus carnosus]
MYPMMKEIITEKDIRRQILLIEKLLNHSQLTAKELAESIHTTERTVFSDIQLIRSQLPDDWMIESDSSGFKLFPAKNSVTTEIWEIFLSQSIGIQILKALFLNPEVSRHQLAQVTSVSVETLKRHINQINRRIKAYQVKIKLTKGVYKLTGKESTIRIFFHRLLLPYTYSNYFFKDYAVHEIHYYQFLKNIRQSDVKIETEHIFGMNWFFINTIRNKANCRINNFSYQKEDPLFSLYHLMLVELYQKEGIYLTDDEAFFSFFCFLESWNYNNTYGNILDDTIHTQYPTLLKAASDFVARFVSSGTLPELSRSKLSDNLFLLLLKYVESPKLSKQFQLEYHELINLRADHYQLLQKFGPELIQQLNPLAKIDDIGYLIHLISLLVQQAIFQTHPIMMTAYFIFQGEPAWKDFLRQEISDALGNRVKVIGIEPFDLKDVQYNTQDIIISNLLLETQPVPIHYISMLPTKNELNTLIESTRSQYLLI